jgi:DNA helicase HerA-like ATPase
VPLDTGRRPAQALLRAPGRGAYLPAAGGDDPVFSILADIFLLGRKYGLGTIVATQRSQKIHKDTISQSELYLLHKVTHPKDIEVYEDLVPLPAKEVRAMLSRLCKGSCGGYTGYPVLATCDIRSQT